MRDDSSIDGKPRQATANEQERIRKLNVADLQALCDRIGAEAQAHGLTEEILNEILNQESTPEETSECRARLPEPWACIAENRELAGNAV